jgi:hypothetical protein
MAAIEKRRGPFQALNGIEGYSDPPQKMRKPMKVERTTGTFIGDLLRETFIPDRLTESELRSRKERSRP